MPRRSLHSIGSALRLAGLVLSVGVVSSGCQSLNSIYKHTENRSDFYTNISAYMNRFPEPSCHRLALSDTGQRGLAARRQSLPAAKAFSPLPGATSSAPAETKTTAPFAIINTDIDDTVQSYLWDRGRYPAKTAYPGVAALLREQGDVLVALTARTQSSEVALREKICRLLQICENVSISGRKRVTGNSLEMGLQKADVLLAELRGHQGQARVIFNGDSGQADWIAALIVRDVVTNVQPELESRFLYSTIHDVRPWSPAHREHLLEQLEASCHLQKIYRRARALSETSCAILTDSEQPLRHDVDRLVRAVASALPTSNAPRRLDAGYLRTQRILLFRNHLELALTLESEGCLSRESADRVIGAAAAAVCFQDESNDFYSDSEQRQQLEQQLELRYGTGVGSGPPSAASSDSRLCAAPVR